MGKPKEETIPGSPARRLRARVHVARSRGHEGETKKVSLTNGAKGQPPGPSFALTIEVS